MAPGKNIVYQACQSISVEMETKKGRRKPSEFVGNQHCLLAGLLIWLFVVRVWQF